MGIASRTLVRSIGIDLPLYPIKGYSISAPVIDPTRSPTRSITDYDRKIVYAPLGDTLRVAGFADIVGQDRRIDATRIGALAREVRHLFPGGCGLNRLHPWAGLRPATPTGVPILGASPLENLLLNVGHGALGFTLACGSGRLLADFVAGRESIVDTADYAYRPTADHFPVRPAVIDVPAT
jgi:D-amino-acid dehydrogenase